MGPFDGVGQQLLDLGVGEYPSQTGVDERLRARRQRRGQAIEVAREDVGDDGLDVDGGEHLIGHPGGKARFDLRIIEGGRHDLSHPVGGEHRGVRPDADQRQGQGEDRDHTADARGDAPPPATLAVRDGGFEHNFWGHVGGHPDSLTNSPVRCITLAG